MHDALALVALPVTASEGKGDQYRNVARFPFWVTHGPDLYPHTPMPVKELYGSRVLTKKEQRVAELVAEGLKNKEIGAKIGTTENVIKNKLRRIYDKVGVWNRLELALWYEARRPISPNAIDLCPPLGSI